MKTIFIKDKKFEPLTEPVCAAIGNFDGVHLGHQKLIDECKRHGYKSAVLTFYPHPSVFLKKIKNYPLVTPLEHKQDILTRLGINYLIVIEFDDELAQMPKEEFINYMKFMNIKSCVCGYDFTFARRAEGDIRDLANEFEFYEVKKFIYDGVRVSSTYIRELISSGNVKEASRLLGRTFSIRGNVIYGSQKGRLIGYPTANINYRNYLLPSNGVYFVNVKLHGEVYLGMCNVGHNPTYNFTDERRMEVNIFNLDEDIYNEEVEVFFVSKLREEHKFESVEELKNQLLKDKEECLKLASDVNYTK